MKRIRSLNLFQKAVLLVATAIAAVFTVLYPLTISHVGFAYQNAILVPSQDNGSTVYSGKIQGETARFTVSADKAVTFQYGGKTYGPYTAQEDPSAIPQDNELREYMTGIELFCGNEVLFRGGVLEHGDHLTLFREDDSLYDLGITVTGSNGIVIDENGNVIDPMEPSASTILEVMAGPTLTHRGSWPPWIGGVLICAVTVLSILFADELFRWNLSFRIRDVEQAEPSDWEIAERYISWIVLPILALTLFIMGLQ